MYKKLELKFVFIYKIQILKIKYYHQSTPTNIEYRQVYKKKTNFISTCHKRCLPFTFSF